MNNVAEWLATDEGLAWSRENFDNPCECHDFIEIIDDTHENQIFDHRSVSDDFLFRRMKRFIREWRDLDWTPDRSP